MTDLVKQTTPITFQIPPSQFANAIRELAEALSKNKTNLKEIQNRNLFQRVFSNNTRDIANALIEQGDTISGFLELIKGVIFCQIGNLSTLMALRDGLIMQRVDLDDAGKSYIDLAVNFLDQALETSKVYNQKFEFVESELSAIQRHLTDKAKIDDEQTNAIRSIEKHIEIKNKLDCDQDTKLSDLELIIGSVSTKCESIDSRISATDSSLGNLRDEVSNRNLYQDYISNRMGKRLKNSLLLLLLLAILTLINSVGLLTIFIRMISG